MKTEAGSRLDTLVQLLRRQLAARTGASARGAARAPARPPGAGAAMSPLARVQALRQSGVQSEAVLQRALVEQLLASALGPALLNDAPFQALVDEVLDALRDDPGMSRLLQTALAPAPQA